MTQLQSVAGSRPRPQFVFGFRRNGGSLANEADRKIAYFALHPFRS
jgi:hypothetical protein